MKEERKDCTECYWYWQNNDTENQCNGSYMWQPCDEFIEKRGGRE